VDLFHSLAQRPPAFRFPKEVVTVFDIFPITGYDYSTAEFRRKFSSLLREAVKRANRIVTLSQYTATQLVRHCAVAEERIRVVPAGVDAPAKTLTPEERSKEREQLVGQGNEMVLSVGAIQTRKNTLNALRALALLPLKYKLVLAGGNGYGSESVFEFIRQERLEARVARLGYVAADRLPTLYESASVFLFPSLEEGFGIPVLEAMIHAIPVVASKTSSLPEVGGDAVLYVDPLDPHAIANQVRRAVEQSGLRERMIAQGLARAREFTWRRAAEVTLEIYEELLAQR